MFDTVDTTYDCVRISTGVLSTLRINPDRMLAGLSADMLATDLAEYLVRKGGWPRWARCAAICVLCACCTGRRPCTGCSWAECQSTATLNVPRPGPCRDLYSPLAPPARLPFRRRALPRDAPHQRRRRQAG
jgi:hypothetical protein